MLKALYEVVSKAGDKMSDVSKNSILGIIDSDAGDNDDNLNIAAAKLLGALIKVLPADAAASLIKSRVLTASFTRASVLGLNAVLVESPETLCEGPFSETTSSIIVQGIRNPQPFIADNCILAAGKFLLTEANPDKSVEGSKALIDALATVVPPGSQVDTRRLALVAIRTLSRHYYDDIIGPQLPTLVPPVFASVRDPIIPVKLAAEAAFLALFRVVDEESAIFDAYMAGPGAELPPQPKRSMQEYFKRIALRLSQQAKERREADASGGLGLSSDEVSDERELQAIGKVDLGENVFGSE